MKTVEVHKADIALLDGESLDQFTGRLRHNLQKAFGKQPTSNDDRGVWIWPRAVFDDHAVIEKSNPMEVGPDVGGDRMFSVTYKRTGSGDFEFGELIAVREQVSFVPVTKVAAEVETVEIDEKVTKSFWGGLPIVV